MQIAQHRPVPTRQEQPTAIHWPTESMSPRSTTMSNRICQPLNFSIDDRLSDQHLTRLDLSSKNLRKIDKLPNNINFNVVLLDNNDITKVEHLDVLTHLVQLSISHNRLIDIRLIGRLRTLQKLNLSNNSLDSIDALKSLPNLVMLNIASNNIHSIGVLNACHSLQSLDVSDNSIRLIEDLSYLTKLKYLNLHQNFVDTLVSAPRHWPKSIHTLVISDNEIKDLSEISYLSQFIDLNVLYIHDNPCLFVTNDRYGCHQPFDYRPFILNWCLGVQNLDGTFITRKESLKAEWLLSQGKGRSFRPGDHLELVQYLIRVCGTDADERDDLHLSRIMLQQDLYRHNSDIDEVSTKTSDTLKDANETLAKDQQSKLQQSLLISESEFRKVNPLASVSTINEPIQQNDQRKISASDASNSDQQMRTPSPKYVRSISHHDEHNSRYSDYDNRPIKPLDQNMFQSKLNQYPIDNHSGDETSISRTRTATNSQQPKRATGHLAYNANRYSPRTTNRGPAVSTPAQVPMRPSANKNLSTHQQDRSKRHTIASDTFNLADPPQRRPSALRAQHEQQIISNDNKHRNNDDDDDDENQVQLKSAPINQLSATQHTTTMRTNTTEITKLTTSIESVRSSVLQAYLNLHERFTKTTELQTSALAALWKTFETQTSTHQRETEKLLEENRALSRRLRDLESRLNIKSCILHPPLRAHISKRDTRSFFLHWIPNPLNDQRPILGYRIYIDDVFKGSVDSGKFETVIDCIRDEGEYKIKLRAYNDSGESEDSNVVIARFRRQQPVTPRSESEMSNIQTHHRTQSDHTINEIPSVPIRQTHSQENLIRVSSERMASSLTNSEQRQHAHDIQSMLSGGFPLPMQQQQMDQKSNTSSPSYSNHTSSNENVPSHRLPVSSMSSPSQSEIITTNESGSKVLSFNDSSAAKRSPVRTGIMSRLVKSPHKIKRNNVLLNALPVNLSRSPKQTSDTAKLEVKSVDRSTTFQPESNSNTDHGHILLQQLPLTSIDTSKSMAIPASTPSPLIPF
ncbi:unnamed protein product [Adineta ricciae]|uniref:Centrosomal protein of 97 kDa n=1 Tax=Adineta ricciae TaxID=249248 RepID=A0A815G365_ADIRI|nr:unnamed protein product [Adineta ricciae]CAF1333341.1 unnamed protein product [Adineta ricciae]